MYGMTMKKKEDSSAMARGACRVTESDRRPLPLRKESFHDLRHLAAQDQVLPATRSPAGLDRRPAGTLDRRLLPSPRPDVCRRCGPGRPGTGTTPGSDRPV